MRVDFEFTVVGRLRLYGRPFEFTVVEDWFHAQATHFRVGIYRPTSKHAMQYIIMS